MKFDQDLFLNLWYELNPRVRCAFVNVCNDNIDINTLLIENLRLGYSKVAGNHVKIARKPCTTMT